MSPRAELAQSVIICELSIKMSEHLETPRVL